MAKNEVTIKIHHQSSMTLEEHLREVRPLEAEIMRLRKMVEALEAQEQAAHKRIMLLRQELFIAKGHHGWS